MDQANCLADSSSERTAAVFTLLNTDKVTQHVTASQATDATDVWKDDGCRCRHTT